jgi:hypothetical protein
MSLDFDPAAVSASDSSRGMLRHAVATLAFAAEGRHAWKDAAPLPWDAEVARFFRGLAALDAMLASGAPLGVPAEKIFQGPVADALTHVGQLAMLRRMAGAPVRGENYYRAEIAAGRVGPEQSAARVEFG